jgi:hypothetical protein
MILGKYTFIPKAALREEMELYRESQTDQGVAAKDAGLHTEKRNRIAFSVSGH